MSLRSKLKRSFFSEAYSRLNLFRLAVFAFIFSTIDGSYSYYLQRMILNPMIELNWLPRLFQQYGFWGYVAYIPVETVQAFVVFVLMWGFASYLAYLGKRLTKRESWKF